MKKFFQKNKIVLAILAGALIIGGAIYFSGKKENFFEKGIQLEKRSQAPLCQGSFLYAKAPLCQNVPSLPDGANKLVTKVIDGDTFLIEGGYSVRILGIDADERGHPCYELAKKRLEELILNKEVRLEKGKEDLDQYCL